MSIERQADAGQSSFPPARDAICGSDPLLAGEAPSQTLRPPTGAPQRFERPGQICPPWAARPCHPGALLWAVEPPERTHGRVSGRYREGSTAL